MITIIHGDDVVSSRNYLLELRKKIKNPLLFDSKNLRLSDLSLALETKSLFSDQNHVFIENLLTSKNSELDSIVKYIEKNRNLFDVVFWEGSEIEKRRLQSFKNTAVKLFKIPQKLFFFLDNIRPRSQNNLILFHDVLKTVNEEIVFYMLVRQFRLLIVLRSQDLALARTPENQIDEIKRLLPWQESKLRRQANNFREDQLRKIYTELYEIDLGLKSGTTLSLPISIDFLLLDL